MSPGTSGDGTLSTLKAEEVLPGFLCVQKRLCLEGRVALACWHALIWSPFVRYPMGDDLCKFSGEHGWWLNDVTCVLSVLSPVLALGPLFAVWVTEIR